MNIEQFEMEDDWVYVDNGSNPFVPDAEPTPGPKPTFLEILMKNNSPVHNPGCLLIVKDGSKNDGIVNLKKTTNIVCNQSAGAVAIDAAELVDNYYETKENREITRLQGINRLPLSSREKKEKRLAARNY